MWSKFQMHTSNAGQQAALEVADELDEMRSQGWSKQTAKRKEVQAKTLACNTVGDQNDLINEQEKIRLFPSGTHAPVEQQKAVVVRQRVDGSQDLFSAQVVAAVLFG